MANGVFWVGQNGNVYTRVAGQDGVKDYGKYDALKHISAKTGGVAGLDYVTRGLQQINDPATSSGSPAPAGGGGGGGGTPLNRAGIENTQRTIDQIPGLLEAALAAERTRYGNTIKDFQTQEDTQRKTYDESTVTNQQNYDSNFMDSIRAGIKGLGGLFQILRGTGAAGGTAEDMARDTVGGVTASDIRTGADTQKENQSQLDNSLSTFLTELARKRQMNEDTLVNNERAIRRDTDTQLQELFGKMAGFYGEAGDQANATNWMNRAGELTPNIAQNSRTQVSNYDTTPVAVKAPEITAFAAPTQPNVAVAPSDGQIGSGLFTMDSRRRKEQAAPVGV